MAPTNNEKTSSKSSAHERISSLDAQDVRATAEDNAVLAFVNATLLKVTNVGRFQCLS